VSQLFHFTGPKGTFGIFDEKLVVLQQVKDFFHMKKVAIPSVVVYEDVWWLSKKNRTNFQR